MKWHRGWGNPDWGFCNRMRVGPSVKTRTTGRESHRIGGEAHQIVSFILDKLEVLMVDGWGCGLIVECLLSM